MSLRKSSLILGSAVTLLAALACNRVDDTEVTARTQANVNHVSNAESEVQVNVDDGVATLTGVVSSDAIHQRALEAAKSTDGVKGIVDHISTPTTLTGATVPK